MNWTDKRPHGTGWWWMWEPDGTPQIVRIIEERFPGCSRLFRFGKREYQMLDSIPFSTRWVGPLPEPTHDPREEGGGL